MPTVVILDTSLSMARLCQAPANGNGAATDPDAGATAHTHLDVAKHGVDMLLQHLVRK